MSDRDDLNRRCAERMGWRVKPGGILMFCLYAPEGDERARCGNEGSAWACAPAYSESLDAARELEDEIERRGLAMPFIALLTSACAQFFETIPGEVLDRFHTGAWLARRATAEQVSRAFLAVTDPVRAAEPTTADAGRDAEGGRGGEGDSGSRQCRKCGFVCGDGADRHERCPNDGERLRGLSWREALAECTDDLLKGSKSYEKEVSDLHAKVRELEFGLGVLQSRADGFEAATNDQRARADQAEARVKELEER